jgi:hypothetical protein
MRARLAAFHAQLDSVDTRREQIDELSGNLQLQRCQSSAMFFVD